MPSNYEIGQKVKARYTDATGYTSLWDGTVKDTDPDGHVKVQIGGIILWFEGKNVLRLDEPAV